jgi:hypothetical protein
MLFAPDPSVMESSKERILIRLSAISIDSGTEQPQIPGRSTGRSPAKGPESRSENILETFLSVEWDIETWIVLDANSYRRKCNEHKITAHRNQTIVGLPTEHLARFRSPPTCLTLEPLAGATFV